MDFYTEAQREQQALHDSRRLADAVASAIVQTELTPQHADFIASRDFFFLSTANGNGEPTVSHKGGNPGFVRVVDSRTLAFPMYDGNGMFLSLGNIAETAKIGMLFMDFETPDRVRVQATASATTEEAALATCPGAIAVVQARIDHVFINCARYIHKHQRVDNSPHVPDETGRQPHAAWKRIDLLQEHLSDTERERTREAGGPITEEEYGRALMRGET